MNKKLRLMLKICILTLSLVLFCEYLVYFVVVGQQCSWPILKQTTDDSNLLRAMFIADTHLLGSRNGHWFDKLRREWQMYRSFQTAIQHQPDVVFILGDLFDEGQWCSMNEFDSYIARFHSLFEVPETMQLYVVPGNHDMGFHYRVNPTVVNRFHIAFNVTPVSLITLKGTDFVLLNSMAMEGDECFLCKPARIQLSIISKRLKSVNSRPVLLQHFPMFRKSDEVCNEPDEAPADIKGDIFRPGLDCLTKLATKTILDKLNPRAIITGHTHHGCLVTHREDILEYTIPSFSWRNKNNPSFLLTVFSPTNHVVNKCFLPKESSVIFIYIVGFICIVFLLLKKKL